MELTATSIDGFLAYWCGLNDVCGEIHSVFEHALNIKTSGGQLVSILCGVDQAGPNTVVARLPEGLDFISMGLRAGMPARLRGSRVQLGTGDVQLRTGSARKWWPRLADGLAPVDLQRLESNLAALDEKIAALPPDRGLGRLLPDAADMAAGRWDRVAADHAAEDDDHGMVRTALPVIENLMSGYLEAEDDALQQGVEGLIGLGSGLTPSGDDLLLGFIGTLGAVSKRMDGREVESILEAVRDHLYENRHRTTFVSANLLAFACAGRVADPILNVIRALLFGETAVMIERVEALLRRGDSSGSEVLLGILLALHPLSHPES
jgi:hypothetical protein